MTDTERLDWMQANRYQAHYAKDMSYPLGRWVVMRASGGSVWSFDGPTLREAIDKAISTSQGKDDIYI